MSQVAVNFRESTNSRRKSRGSSPTAIRLGKGGSYAGLQALCGWILIAVSVLLFGSDSLGRWIGGDFVLMLPKTDAPSAMVLVKKMHNLLLREERFTKFSIRFSFGITEIMAEDTVSELVERSRSAMQRVVDEAYERIAVH